MEKWFEGTLAQRFLSLALSIVMVLSVLPMPSIAVEGDGLCEHHKQHIDCGYVEAVAGHECGHVCGEECYTVTTDCQHVHDESCYSDSVLPAAGEEKEPDKCTHTCSEESGCVTKAHTCTHKHDGSCGYVEAVAGSPCTYQCDLCTGASEPELLLEDTVLTDWEWVDPDEWLDETGSFAMPGVMEDYPAYFEDVVEYLPTQITALIDGVEVTLDLGVWECDDYPMETGTSQGEYVFETTLPEGYTLPDGTNVLSLTVVLGDPEGHDAAMMTVSLTEPPTGTYTIGGESVTAYELSTKEHLYWFANEVNKNSQLNINAVLMNDITVNSNVLNANGEPSGSEFETWTPIGSYPSYVYSGKFDGQGHTIYGLYVNSISKWHVGLFGASGGTITNVKVADSYFNAMKRVGGVCGINGGTVSNCVNSGTVIAYSNVGGVCGENITYVSYGYQGTITGCYNTGTVKGTDSDASVGGVCGSNYIEGAAEKLSLIMGCYNTGAVSGTNKGASVGGVCGYNGSSTIKNCYNTGAVSGTGSNANVGGVCGYSNFTSATITGCYSTGSVSGTTTYTGGVCGCNNTGSAVNNCYYNTDTYNGEPVGRDAEGTISGTVGGDVLGKTAREFASGQVAYLLNGNSSSGIWKQNLDVDTPDAAPQFTGGTVYTTALTSTCQGYSNTDNCTRDHNYAGGICLWCGEDTNLYITVSGITAKDKTYDGTTTATLDCTNVVLTGKEDGDDVSVTATGTFDSKDAGSRTVTITGLTLTGNDASKYRLANSGQQTTTTASITPKGITVTITPGGGTYGGTITPATASLEGVLPGETVPAVTLFYRGYANDGDFHSGQTLPANAGTYTVVAVNISSGNYTLTGTRDAQFVINKATVTTPTVASKVYTGETLTADVPASERYTVSQNNGGTDVGSYNVVLALTDAHNYQWDEKAGTPTFQITKADNAWTTNPAINGWTYGDTPSTPTGAAKFGTMKVEYKVKDADDSTYTETQPKNAGTYTARFTVAATDNYAGLSVEKDFTISPKPVTVRGITAENKTYDGNTDAELVCTNAKFGGKLEGDTLTVTATGKFADANAGESKTVNITDLTLGGASKDNYALATEGQQTQTQATIFKAASSVSTAPEDAKGLYSGNDVSLVKAGTANGGTMQYRLGEDGDWSTTIPTATDCGKYTVYYKVVGDSNHNDTEAQSLTAEIVPFKIDTQPLSVNIHYGEDARMSVVLNTSLTEQISYQWYQVTNEGDVALPGGTAKELTIPKLNAGNYTYVCKVTCGEYTQHSKNVSVTVSPGAINVDTDTNEGLLGFWLEGGEAPAADGQTEVSERSPSSRLLTQYTEKEDTDEAKGYPTGMEVYKLVEKDGNLVPDRVEIFTNLLKYEGCSIRITGKPGIRMITSIDETLKKELIRGGYGEFKLVAYGTVAQWTNTLNGKALTLSTGNPGYAYDADSGKDPIFGRSGGRVQYTNVLVWNELAVGKYNEDIVMRPFIKLRKGTQELIIYGGTVSRSIGYVAKQNANTFPEGSAGYKYVHDIIDKVTNLPGGNGE